MALNVRGGGISRRSLLVGGGAAGLLLAWGLWPRHYRPNLRAGPGETVFNAFLRIGTDGRVIIAVPQAEIGQGVYTSLPQILADELGADWRTVSVEPAPLSPLYANQLLAEQLAGRSLLGGIGDWAVREYATRTGFMMTGGSTSIRAFEGRMREAGAAARALLMKAAADRWNADWELLDTAGGFVLNGSERIRFGELAEAAARQEVPGDLPIRGGIDNRLVGQSLPRLDLPAKVDGSAQFAGDIRLPDMVYASIRQAPPGGRLISVDRAAADGVAGALSVVEDPRWAAVVATNWWGANKAAEALKPLFTGGDSSSASIDGALALALEGGEATRFFGHGDVAAAYQGGNILRAHYAAGPAPSAPMETLTATARLNGDRLEVWAPTQAPGFARAAAARAAGIAESQVTLYPTMIGSGYGRKLESDAIVQAVTIARAVKRPVQLVWPRSEEIAHDTVRPPARAVMTARLAEGGTILGWQARIAAPSTLAEVSARLQGGEAGTEPEAEAMAVDGAMPPYAIPAVAIDHLPAQIGVPTGIWRSGARSYTACFTESFIDELARAAKIEPLSFRMQMLGPNPRLARVLSTAAALGGWDGGGPGSSLGLAVHSAFGSHIAILVEVEVNAAQRVRVLRAVSAVDCGRIINPEIVRQQIEGGIIHGIAGATGNPLRIANGMPSARRLRELAFPVLGNSPEVTVEIIPSEEDPGGVTELGVPPVAPAIANALFALTGRRLRSLPLVVGGA